jgi:hypothetical protein
MLYEAAVLAQDKTGVGFFGIYKQLSKLDTSTTTER